MCGDTVVVFALLQGDCSIVVVAGIDAKERVALGVERPPVVVVHTYHELIDILLPLTEYKSVIEKQDNEGRFLLRVLVEHAVFHIAHNVSFCE